VRVRACTCSAYIYVYLYMNIYHGDSHPSQVRKLAQALALQQRLSLSEGRTSIHNWGGYTGLKCVESLVSRITTDALFTSSSPTITSESLSASSFASASASVSISVSGPAWFVWCKHVYPEQESTGILPFSRGSVALGYVGWLPGGAAGSCTTGDITSTSFVLRRLRALDVIERTRARAQGRAAAPPVLMDIGAGVGEFALLAVHLATLRVHAFEPGPKPREQLRINIARNLVADRVSVHALGLSNVSSSSATLRAHELSFGHGSIAPISSDSLRGGRGWGEGGQPSSTDFHHTIQVCVWECIMSCCTCVRM